MIVDLERFIDEEKRYWTELESILASSTGTRSRK